MKLSEVIKAIEDGKVDRAKSGLVLFERVGNYITFYYNGMSLFSIGINQQFEEVKLPRQWIEKELMLFKLFPWANYYSKNGYGDLIFTELSPNKIGDAFELSEKSSGRYVILVNSVENEFDSTITKEESPIYIGDLKGE